MMSKRVLVLVGFVFSFVLSFGQKKAKDEAYQLMAKDACECIEKEDLKGMNSEQLTMKLGICMMKSYTVHKKTNKYLKNNPIKDYEKWGEEVGMEMAVYCPDVIMRLAENEEFMEEALNDESSTVDSGSDEIITFEATFVSVHNDAVSYIKVVDEFNKEHSILILNEFEGSNLLKKENAKKKVKISYEEYSLYDLSEQGYTNKKVLKSIEL